VVVTEGGSTVLNCNNTGISKPSTTWSHLNQSESSTNAKQGDELQLSNLKTSDVGVYMCTVQSSPGQVKRYFNLHVLGTDV
jgi:hypothetical protein